MSRCRNEKQRAQCILNTSWCLLFVLMRRGLRGESGPQRLIRALGIETGNPIMTLEQRSSFLPSVERAPLHTPTGIPEGLASTDFSYFFELWVGFITNAFRAGARSRTLRTALC